MHRDTKQPAVSAAVSRSLIPGLVRDLITFDELIEYTGFSRTQVYRLMKDHGLPARRISARWKFSKAEVDEWLKSLPGVNLPPAS